MNSINKFDVFWAFVFLLVLAVSAPVFAQTGSAALVPVTVTPLPPIEQRDSTSTSAESESLLSTITGTCEPDECTGAVDATKPADFQKILQQLGTMVYIAKTKEIQTIVTASSKYNSETQKSCGSSQKLAADLCLESNPNIRMAVMAINGLSGISSLAVKDSCSKMSKGLDIANKSLAAYSAACAAVKVRCSVNCAAPKKALEAMFAAIKKPLDPISSGCAALDASGEIACTTEVTNYNTNILPRLQTIVNFELNSATPTSIAKKNDLCWSKYANLLVSAGALTAQLAKTSRSSKNCEEQTASTAQNLAEKCQSPQHQATAECQCLNNPKAPGCASYQNQYKQSVELQKTPTNIESLPLQNTYSTNVGASSATSTTTKNPSSDSYTGSANSTAGSGSVVSAPAGIGIDGYRGVSSQTAKSNEGNPEVHDGKSKKTSNGSDAYSVSGGGSSGSSAYSPTNPEAYAAYRAYLPGGEKDPNRKIAGQKEAEDPSNREVTGPGGKSNWDKIRNRYILHKTGLIGY